MNENKDKTYKDFDNSQICNICEINQGKYVCPKCNVLYCSLICYRTEKHVQCSEIFYQDCIKEEIKSKGKDFSALQKMSRIVKEVNDEFEMDDIDSDDYEETPDLAERLKNIDLNDTNTVWNNLTLHEQQEFVSLINSGNIADCIPVFHPWWKQNSDQIKTIEEIDTTEDLNLNHICPTVLDNVKPFYEITKKEPAACVKYNILNVVAAYTFMVRYFNGDHFDYAKEALYVLTNLSNNLLLNVNFQCYIIALESVSQQSLQNKWASDSSKQNIHEDVQNILMNSNRSRKTQYVLCVLSDIYNLLIYSKKQKVTQNKFSVRFMDHTIPEDKLVSKEAVRKCVLKIEYYLSYVNTFDPYLNFFQKELLYLAK